MKKFILNIFLIFLISNAFSQSNLLWKGYFSYNQIKGISESNNKLFAAAENAIFSKDLVSGDVKTFNTIDGLSGETISNIYYSPIFNKTIIGYENGLLIVINEADKSVFKAIGITLKQIPANVKKINKFIENAGKLYIATDFGIIQFDLNNNQFGDTYFFGTSVSSFYPVKHFTIFDNSIYAVTPNNGIFKGDLSNQNLIDFNQWSLFNAGYWGGIATINNQLVAQNSDTNLYKFTGNTPIFQYAISQLTVDFRVFNEKLVCTTPNKVFVFNNQLTIISQIDNASISTLTPTFNFATIVNDTIFIGTLENGVVSNTITNPSIFNNITPNSPIRNTIFAINATTENLWAVYGGYKNYNPYDYDLTQPGNDNKPNRFGYSIYNQNGWQNTPYNEAFPARALCKITINPKNPNQVFLSSYFSGLLKVENGLPVFLYNKNNSGIESELAASGQIRVNGTAFDKSGNLWVSNSLVTKALKILKPDNTWQFVDFQSPSYNLNSNDVGNIVIDKNNTKWFPNTNTGLIGYNENGNIIKVITGGSENGNLPVNDARVVAIDNKNQLWIGTISGLRVVSNVDSFLSSVQIRSTNIIIEEDGLGQELFYEQSITDIVVDGANRKWIGTAENGIFLISPNGQKTIYHFTIDDSPLPSNAILDIDIDQRTGEVFIATLKGMISFKGVSTKGKENLEEVYIYPNPVRPEFSDTVKISGLLDKATVKITDIEGSLVYETTSEGGTIEWDTTAFGKYKVASGVYMVFISASDGIETKVKKLMIVR